VTHIQVCNPSAPTTTRKGTNAYNRARGILKIMQASPLSTWA